MEEQKEREQKEDDSDESDESEDSEDDGQSESEEEGVRLNSVNDFKDQLAFLSREYTKLQRMGSKLHSKSDANDAKIRDLRNEVRILKGENGDEKGQSAPPPSADDLMGDLFGGGG